MPVIFPCPACGRELEAPDTALGIEGTCRFCGARVIAPGGDGTSSDSTPPDWTYGATPLDVRPISVPTGRVDPSRILSETWHYLTKYWGVLLAAHLIVNVLFMVVLIPLFVGMVVMAPGSLEASGSASPADPPIWFTGLILLVELLAYPMLVGSLYVADRIIARGDASLGAVFGWTRHYGALLGYFALLALSMAPIVIVMALMVPLVGSAEYLMIPVVVVGIIWYGYVLVALGLGVMEIIDRGSGVIPALQASWEFTKGHRWAILGTGILLNLVAAAGVIACYFGLFFTMSAMPLGMVLIYRHLRGLQGGSDA